MIWLATAFVIECVGMFVSIRRGVGYLIGSAIVNMAMIALLGSQLVTIGGLTTNAGSIFYTFIFVVQAALLKNRFEKQSVQFIYVVLYCAVLRLCLLQATVLLPRNGVGLTNVLVSDWRFTTSSFLAFFTAMTIFIWIWRRLERFHWFWRYAAATIAGQAIDSIIFFTVFLDSSSIWRSIEFMVTGFALKVVLGLVAASLLLFPMDGRIDDNWPRGLNG